MDLINTRSCGDCFLCCKLPTVPGVSETPWDWCQHCTKQTDAGCAIYEDRPDPCRNFSCLWLKEDVPLSLDPSKTRVMLTDWEQHEGGIVAWEAIPGAAYKGKMGEWLLKEKEQGRKIAVMRPATAFPF